MKNTITLLESDYSDQLTARFNIGYQRGYENAQKTAKEYVSMKAADQFMAGNDKEAKLLRDIAKSMP